MCDQNSDQNFPIVKNQDCLKVNPDFKTNKLFLRNFANPI